MKAEYVCTEDGKKEILSKKGMSETYCHYKCLVPDEKTDEDKEVPFIPLFLADKRTRFYRSGYGVYPVEGTCPRTVSPPRSTRLHEHGPPARSRF